MTADIQTTHNLRRSLRYNEQKLDKGEAECLYAGNFLRSADDLSFDQKLRRFQQRAELNTRVSTWQHISLNCPPTDHLYDEQMKRIARCYMKEIGFQNQPYLVYRHVDSGHPHCHIVTTHIKPDGDPMDLYNIGRDRSRDACKKIEEEFDLTPSGVEKEPREKPEEPRRLKYGEAPTTVILSDGIDQVYDKYIYTNLNEYNVALRSWHVKACPSKRGLLYRYINDEGRIVGCPVPASFFDSQPTLENLETKFSENEKIRENERNYIDSVCTDFSRKSCTFEDLRKELSGEFYTRIIPEKDKTGHCTEIYYIRYRPEPHTVWTGSELGPNAGPEAIQRIIDQTPEIEKLREEEALRESLDYRQRLRLRI